jgi:arylsulfatase A-like enzyme
VAALLVIAPAQRALRGMRESRQLAALPEPPAGATNVLFIILDTVRAASMGLYSVTDSTTPRLDEWGRTGTVFDWAFSPAPWTLPSHGSMFTGAMAGEQSGDWERPLDRELPTLAERFRDRGYLTAGFVANMHYTAWDSGLPRGFARYEDYLVNWRQLVLSSSYTQTELYSQLRWARGPAVMARAIANPNLAIDPKHRFAMKRGNAVTDAFLDWHASNGERPFFVFLNYFDAHQPYYAPREFRRFPGENGLGAYRAAIAFLDAELDRLLVALRERGVLDNTLVVITSDHGELFGFKGLSGHAHNLYLNTIRVPLFLRLPGRVAEGARVSQPVSLRDLAATVMELAAPDAPPLPGISLSRTWTGSGDAGPVVVEVTHAKNVEAHLPTSRGNMQSLLDTRWQLIRHDVDGRLELYDYRVDSLEEHDLAGTDSVAAVLDGLRQRLLDLLRPTR